MSGKQSCQKTGLERVHYEKRRHGRIAFYRMRRCFRRYLLQRACEAKRVGNVRPEPVGLEFAAARKGQLQYRGSERRDYQKQQIAGSAALFLIAKDEYVGEPSYGSCQGRCHGAYESISVLDVAYFVRQNGFHFFCA